MPVPAGPIAKVTVFAVDGVDVALLTGGLRADRLAAAQHLGAEHLGGSLVGFQHLDGASEPVGVEVVAGLEEHDELLEEAPDPFGVGARRR